MCILPYFTGLSTFFFTGLNLSRSKTLSPNLLFLTRVPHKAACFLLSFSLSLQTTVFLVTNLFAWFSDDTTVIGCVNNANGSVYREEVQRLVGWCNNNNLVLNISKTKEMIIDFRKKKTPIHTLFIDGAEVLQADCVKILGSTISKHLSWCNNSIDIIKKKHKNACTSLDTSNDSAYLKQY